MKSLKIIIIFLFVPVIVQAGRTFGELSGRILLQVEQNGEAWYVDPAGKEKYFLNRPKDAFEIMRKFGVGIKDEDLLKIEIGQVEMAPEFLDSDNDGFSDNEEIKNNYNPYGKGKINIDIKFVNNSLGKIFLQVEKNGEAWYINPVNGKRYFLARPLDAFNLMSKLGLGIRDNDLKNIPTATIQKDMESDELIVFNESQRKAQEVILLAAENFRTGTAESTKKYFTEEVYRFVDQIFLVLSPGERLLLGNMMSAAKDTKSIDSEEVFTTDIYFEGDKVPYDYNVKQQKNGSWLVSNL